MLPSPPSWKRQHQDACLSSLHTSALQDIATTAVAAPASLLVLASHLPEQTAGDPGTKLGGNVAASSSFEVKDPQAPLPEFHTVEQRSSQQDLTVCSPLLEQGAQLANRPDAEGAVRSAHLQGLASAPFLSNSGDLVRSPLTDPLYRWEQQPRSGSKPAAGSLHPGQGQKPNSMLPVLQSPFAAIAALPIYHQQTQTAATQEVPLASASGQQWGPQEPSPLTNAEAAAQAAIQAPPPPHAQQSLLGQPKMPQLQQKLHRERPPSGLGKKAQATLRLPLSPSSVRSNGEANVLQPLAKGQARSPHPGSGLHSSSGKPQSLLPLGDCKLGSKASQPVCHSELLPGRNVVVSNADVTDLAHLLIPPSQWCW